MKPEINIQKVKFEFNMSNEETAFELYSGWHSFYHAMFEKVLEQVLSSYNKSDVHFLIEKLDLDLGEIPKEDFYEKFPVLLEEKLTEFMQQLSLVNSDVEVKKVTGHFLHFEAFTYYLIHGFYPWPGNFANGDFKAIFSKVITLFPDELRDFLFNYGHYSSLRRRLALQLEDDGLQRLVKLVNHAESPFIISYFNLLVNEETHKKVGAGKVRDHRNACWEVILAYLIVTKSGYFNRREFVSQTIRELAAHYNIGYNVLLSFLTHTADSFLHLTNEHSELKKILLELNGEVVHKGTSEDDNYQQFIDEIAGAITTGALPGNFDTSMFEKLLSNDVFTAKVLAKFTYLQLIKLADVLRNEASRSSLSIEIQLSALLEASIRKVVDSHLSIVGSEQGDETLSSIYLTEIKRLLKQPLARRMLIAGLDDPSIYSLVKALAPAESGFIISYSQSLDEQRERNIFEGKAGGEFRQLKWEFIFAVMIEDADMSFNRKSFVFSVITLLASHYNMKTHELLSYIYKAILDGSISVKPDLSEIIKELYFESKAEKPKLQEVNQFDKALREAYYSSILKSFIQSGVVVESSFSNKIFDILVYLETYRPDLLLSVVEDLKKGFLLSDSTSIERHKEFYLRLIRFTIDSYQINLPSGTQTKRLLDNLDYDRYRGVSVSTFKMLLLAILRNDVSLFGKAWDILTEKVNHFSAISEDLLISLTDEVLLKAISLLSAEALQPHISSEPKRLVERIFANSGLFKAIIECYLIDPSMANKIESTLQHIPLSFLFSKMSRMFPSESEAIKVIFCMVLAVRPAGEGYGSLVFEMLVCLEKNQKPFFEVIADWLFKNVFKRNELKGAISFLEKKLKTALLSTSMKKSIGSVVEKARHLQSNKTDREENSEQKDFLGWLTKNFGTSRIQSAMEILLPMVGTNPVAYSEFEKMMIEQPNLISQLIDDGKLSKHKINGWVKNAPFSLQLRWIQIVSHPYQKILVNEVFLLISWMQAAIAIVPGSVVPWQEISSLLFDFTSGKLQHIGRDELFSRLIALIIDKIDVDKDKVIAGIQTRASNHGQLWGKRIESVLKKVINSEKSQPVISDQKTSAAKERIQEEDADNLEEIYIGNAGLVLCTPFLPQLFTMLGYVQEGVFTDRKLNERAVLLLQYMLYGQTYFPEHEMVLNKVLCGLTTGTPIDCDIEVTPNEKTTIEQMLTGMIQHWGKLGNTSVRGLVESFFLREGKLVQKEDMWQLTVGQKGFDVLLDSLPWSYTPIKHRWMKKPLIVKWR